VGIKPRSRRFGARLFGAQVFKKYSQMKLQMKREALEKLSRRASEMAPATGERMRTVMVQ